MERKLRMGMIGGGRGAFIGNVHRMAAELDGRIELVCGAFSSDPERSLASGRDWCLREDRVYRDYQDMIRREKELPGDVRMDFVCIVTPNDAHVPAARAALEAGFHVVCDKPLARGLDEARWIQDLAEERGVLFALTHNYSGYPMVKEARERIRAGQLGRLRRVVVEYPQGWLATALESSGHKQASWRTNPERAGPSGCMGDIGTHAFQLVEYVTGLLVEEVAADLTTFVRGRALDDDGSVLLHLEQGCRGLLWASQIAVGEENALSLRVYGETGALAWSQEEPNTLVMRWLDRPREIVRAGLDRGSLSEPARRAVRLPAGHPEGFVEAFANVYSNFARALAARIEGREPAPEDLDFPGVRDGVRGMAFVQAVVDSSRAGQKWIKIPVFWT